MTVYTIPPLLTLLSFISLGGIIIKQKRWHKSDALFFIICLLGSLLYLDIVLIDMMPHRNTVLLVRRFSYLFLVYLFPVYLHFFYIYLDIRKRTWAVPAAYACAFVLMGFTQSPLFLGTIEQYYFGYFPRGGPIYSLFSAVSILIIGYVAFLMFQSIKAERNIVRKNKLKYMLAGFGLLGLLNAGNFLPLSGFSVYPPGNFSFIPLVIFGFGLFKHDLLDSGLLIRKGVVYSLLTSFLTCLYALIVIGTEYLLSGYGFSGSIYSALVFFLIVAAVFGPVNHAVRKAVDAVLNKDNYDYRQTLKNVGRMITAVLDLEQIVDQIIGSLKESMKIDNACLFLRTAAGEGFEITTASTSPNHFTPRFFPDDTALVQMLKRNLKTVLRSSPAAGNNDEFKKMNQDMDRLNAVMVIPLNFRGHLKGFLSLGEKSSGESYSIEDIDLLETLAVQGALAVQNALTHEKIKSLNRDLEKIVEVRTAELKNALLEKEKTQDQLIRSESLASIGQLVAGTAHELNNPLASAASILQSSIEDIQDSGQQALSETDFINDLAFARKQIERAADIVKCLLDLSRQTQTFTESVDVNSVIKDALKILYNQHKQNNIEIIESYHGNLPAIRGNFSNLGQVMVNILQNAIHAVKEGGKINISTRYDADAGHVIIECADNGPGIPEALRWDIFKPFFTTKPVGQGTGLGLYICHQIIEKHKGKLILSDSHGHGAKFVVRLPA